MLLKVGLLIKTNYCVHFSPHRVRPPCSVFVPHFGYFRCFKSYFDASGLVYSPSRLGQATVCTVPPQFHREYPPSVSVPPFGYLRGFKSDFDFWCRRKHNVFSTRTLGLATVSKTPSVNIPPKSHPFGYPKCSQVWFGCCKCLSWSTQLAD